MVTKSIFRDLQWENVEHRNLLKMLLQDEKVVISSTDTIYGFLGSLTQGVYDKICALKEVSERRPFLILVGSATKVDSFVAVDQLSSRIKRFLALCWPGPVTFIFKARPGLADFLVSEDGTIALRCPSHQGLLDVLSDFDGLFSTSANKSGCTPPERFVDISDELLQKVEAIISDENYDKDIVHSQTSAALPSSLVDLSLLNSGEDGVFPFRIVRRGAFSIEKLKEAYERAK